MMNTCDGCRFLPSKATCKRCLTCSRNYADKHQAPPPRKPLTPGGKAALVRLTAMMAAITAMPLQTAEEQLKLAQQSFQNQNRTRVAARIQTKLTKTYYHKKEETQCRRFH